MAIPGFGIIEDKLTPNERKSIVMSGTGENNYQNNNKGFIETPRKGYSQKPIGIIKDGYLDQTISTGYKRPTTTQEKRILAREKRFSEGNFNENQKKLSRRRFNARTLGMEREQEIGLINTSGTAEKIQQRRFDERIKQIKEQQRKELWQTSKTFKAGKTVMKSTEQALGSAAAAAGVASLGQNFSPEQKALQQMFGHGEKMWGLGNESGTKVTINNDLNPSKNGDLGTADIFGFGGRGERSGLF